MLFKWSLDTNSHIIFARIGIRYVGLFNNIARPVIKMCVQQGFPSKPLARYS